MSELNTAPQEAWVCDVRIPAGEATLDGDLQIPAQASGIVLFAHGSGSSRHSPRNQYVARVIRATGIGTLLFDLLTPEEEVIDPEAVQRARYRYACFEDFGEDTQAYGYAASFGLSESCEKEVVSQLHVSHYFEARMAEQFDAVLHFDQTRALEPLEPGVAWKKGEAPETFPSGL